MAAESGGSRRGHLLAWSVGFIAFCVYLMAPVPRPTWDTVGTRLLPFSIIRDHNLDLDEFGWLRRLGDPYFLKPSADGHWQSKYPIATGVAISPLYVPAVLWQRVRGIEDDDVRFRALVVAMERISAAAIAALSVALVFLGAAALTSPGIAFGVALVYAFGTDTWAITSSALWQHGLVQVAIAGLALCLLRPESRRTALGAGVFAGLGVAARPTVVVFAAAAAMFFLVRRRRTSTWFLLPLLLLGGAVGFYNLVALGGVSGGYRAPLGGFQLTAIFGLLISPNRGLFVFTPVAVFALPAIVAGCRRLASWGRRTQAIEASAGLDWLALAVVLNWVGFSLVRTWWGGFGFGPRFFCDALPVLALLSVSTVTSLCASKAGRVLIGVLTAATLSVQIVGVYRDDGSWDRTPVSVDEAPWRVWDFSDTQIGRALGNPWRLQPFMLTLGGFLADPRPATLRELDGSELRGDLTIDAPTPLRWRGGAPNRLQVRLTNRSDVVWPAFSDFGYLEVAVVATLEQSVATARLPHNLGPGESVDLQVEIEAPPRNATGEVQVRLVQVRDVAAGAFGGAEVKVPVQLRVTSP